MRLDAKDYLEMPAKIVTDIRVDLQRDARKTYETLKKQFVVKLRNGEVTAANAGALTSKLRQLSNGWVYTDDEGRKHECVHTMKLEALEDLIESLQGNPLLVAYEFKSERAELADYFDAPYIGGGVSAKRGKTLEQKWNDAKLPVLLVHPQSVGHGLNLQRGGNHIAWFGHTYNYEAYEQLIDRIWRQGQEKPVYIYHLIARNTVDALIMQSLRGKRQTQNAFLNALRKEFL
jgi:SNF2 family DNA or RNA helicase